MIQMVANFTGGAPNSLHSFSLGHAIKIYRDFVIRVTITWLQSKQVVILLVLHLCLLDNYSTFLISWRGKSITYSNPMGCLTKSCVI